MRWAGGEILNRFLPILLATICTASVALANHQKSGSTGIYTISDNVDLVLLDVSVKDPHGGYVTGLKQDNFQVFEDGHRRRISQFASVDTPVTVGLVVDNSGSMRTKRPEVILAGLAFAKESNPQDEFFVINFNNSVTRGLPASMMFTDNLQILRRALYFGEATGQTALYDAVAYALNHLEFGQRDKRTLIIVSDGGDNVSDVTLGELMKLIESSRATIYTVGLLDPQNHDLNPGVLRKMAAVSGGEFFQPSQLSDIIPVFNRISKDIRNRYTIGYVPDETNDRRVIRMVKVAATGNGRKLLVRTRRAYSIIPFSKQISADAINASPRGGELAMTYVNSPPGRRSTVYYVRPGEHSHNTRRRAHDPAGKRSALRMVRLILLLMGILGTGYYSYTLGNQYVYQRYENWAFDQQIAGRKDASIADYIRERTPFGFMTGKMANAPAVPHPAPAAPAQASAPPLAAPPPEGALLGRVEVKRLSLSAIVRQGVDAKMLSVAVGHVPSTALPGQVGNFAIAAHRDTLFRGLKDIRKGDLVTFQSPGRTYTYQVFATKIVKPSDVSVLRPDGGALIPAASADSALPGHLLTMITCYPFYYVGSAPERFIVQARLLSDQAGSTSHHAS